MSGHGLASMSEFRRHARRDAPRMRKAERVWPFAIVAAVFFLVFGAIGAFVIALAFDSGAPDRLEVFLSGVAMLLIGTAFLGMLVSMIVTVARRWRRRRAAAAVALAHGWHYALEGDPRNYSGALFRAGARGWVENSMHVHDPRYVELGNYAFQAEQGRSFKALEEVGFVAVQLDRALPHMYLQAQGRRRPRPYAVGFPRGQRMDLEGDFPRYFRLFVPEGYGEDALYVFTPDLMQTFVDHVPGCDVEIVDDTMWVYLPGPLDVTGPSALVIAAYVAETAGAQLISRGSRYTDDRATEPGRIEPEGRRLTGVNRWALILTPPAATLLGVLAVGAAQGMFA